jgi:hypothetical protein
MLETEHSLCAVKRHLGLVIICYVVLGLDALCCDERFTLWVNAFRCRSSGCANWMKPLCSLQCGFLRFVLVCFFLVNSCNFVAIK